MAEEEEKISSSEEYHRKSNKKLLLAALLVLGVGVVGWAVVGGWFSSNVDDVVIHRGGEGFVRDQGTVQPHEINFGSAAALRASPNVLNLDAIEVGQTARGVISLTAQGGAIQVLGAEFENRQDGTLELQNGCQPDRILEEGESCILTVQWRPASAYKFSNIIRLRWQTRRVGGGFDRPRDQVLDITGDARTPCIGVCPLDEIRPLQIIAIGGNGQVIGQVHSSGQVIGPNAVAAARALSDGTVVSIDRREIMGRAVNMGPVINASGQVLGQVQANGHVENAARQVIGRMSVEGVAVDNAGAIIGYPMPRGFVVNATGRPLGEIRNNGQVTDQAGALVGVVLPDGSVMSNGATVGWLAPQGIVINGPCRAIGHVSPDGQVTDGNRQNLGFVLPSGVAVTRSFRIIGSVVRQGAVVNDTGAYIGYVNQSGQFVDLRGEISGCVNPDASVSLDSGHGVGHVMGTGFAIDDTCNSLGMVRSDGQVWATGPRNMGNVMGNGFVVSGEGALLGRVAGRSPWQYNITFGQDSHFYGAFLPSVQGLGKDLNTAVALDHTLSMVNREGRKIGCAAVSGSIYSADGTLTGSLVEMGAVVDAEGSFIGVIDPSGRVMNQQGMAIGAMNSLGMAVGIAADGRAMVVGYRMPRGVVLNDQGDVIGSIAVDGRVADASGFVVGRVLGDGVVVGRDGAVVGFNVKPGFAVSVRDGTVTLLNSNGELANRQGQRVGHVTHGGSVIGADGRIIAESFPIDSFVVGRDGTWLGRFNSRGELVNAAGGVIGRPRADGRVYNARSEIIGTLEQPSAFVDSRGNVAGVSRTDGRVTGLLGEPMGRHLSGGAALSDRFEIIGFAVPKGRLFMNPAGQIAGTKQPDGRVINRTQRLIGMTNGAGIVLDDGGRVIGSIIEERPVFDSLTAQGQFVGMVRGGGQVYGNAENLGRVIAGGIAVGNDGRTIGYTLRRERPRPIYGNFGRYIGLARLDGVGVDTQGQERFRVEADGAAYTADGELAGRALDIKHIAVSNDGHLLGAMSYSG
ncbi:MAG: hypothetical protein FWF01_00145, partial [Alphaproteobacteria bacterium]|nr:hypothetical protein [Alphaproteobacteria bacterium]